ncbi:ABC transporter substrate-binding protein [Nocardioides sp.]|uniref:ABC transporter substrate-binding protein n=1 Tax=Nocardioides sp. TaxID=35761 RepID=UPI0026158195|nr:ABC transporter substrate-binding protein [Nocardioides sp.]MDI6912499.1 ABC transporter substrate-binding protein [Nocardioides sp.]
MKKAIVVIIVAVAVAGLVGCGSDNASPPGEASPLRIGVITSPTGAYAPIGQEIVELAEWVEKKINEDGGVDGRPVELFVEDDQLNPEVGTRAAERLIGKEDVSVLIGTLSSAVSLAVSAVAVQNEVVLMNTISSSPSLTGADCNPFSFRVNKNDDMSGAVIEAWMADEPSRSWVTVGYDYEWGHTATDEFAELAKAHGDEVKAQLFTPLTTSDFASVISPIVEEQPDAVWTAMAGPGFTQFVKQLRQFGYMGEIGGGANMTESNVAALGQEGNGVFGVLGYNFAIDTEQNKEFVDAWNQDHPQPPSNFQGDTYAGFQAVFAAVREAGSVEGVELQEALSGLTFDSVFGETSFRPEDNQAETPGYFGVVEDGKVKVTVSVDAEKTGGEPQDSCTL